MKIKKVLISSLSTLLAISCFAVNMQASEIKKEIAKAMVTREASPFPGWYYGVTINYTSNDVSFVSTTVLNFFSLAPWIGPVFTIASLIDSAKSHGKPVVYFVADVYISSDSKSQRMRVKSYGDAAHSDAEYIGSFDTAPIQFVAPKSIKAIV